MCHYHKIVCSLILIMAMILPAGIAFGADVHAESHVEEPQVDVSGMILGHIGDAYEWHFTTIGTKHITLSLPIIVYSGERGWYCFSSARLHHHNTYEGFYIASEGVYAGKVVEVIDGQEVRPIDISLTKNALALLINGVLLISIILYCARWYRRKTVDSPAPRGFVGLIEMLVQMIYNDVVKANIPQHIQRYAPYLLTVFFFIFINNLIGLIPGAANLTGNIAVTFVLAMFTFVMVNVFGNKEYWKEILLPDVPGWLKPIMAVIEIIGIFTKPTALMLRLFANIMAGHTALLALFSIIFITGTMGAMLNGSMTLLSLSFCIFMNCLECLVAFIQAYVFTMLSAVFIGLSQPQHHAEEHHS